MVRPHARRGCSIGLGINLNLLSIAKIVQRQKDMVIITISRIRQIVRFLILKETLINPGEFNLNIIWQRENVLMNP